MYCLFKTSRLLNNPNDSIRKAVSSIAISSYGIYLIHSQLIMVVRKVLHVSFDFKLEYMILFFVGFVISWIVIYILAKIPFLDEWVGVK